LLDRVRGIEIEQRDIAGAGGVDPVELPVGGAESPADTDATVITFENQNSNSWSLLLFLSVDPCQDGESHGVMRLSGELEVSPDG
jgi:hypothetical protein